MDNHIKNKLKDLPQIALTAKEKVLVRENLLNFMAENPVVEEQNRGLFANFTDFFHFKRMQAFAVKPLVAVLVALVGTGAGTSLAAQTALPGDLLYDVKIHINENVKSFLAVSNEEEAQVALDLAEERLNEAAQLAAKNQLSTETKAVLKAQFEQHSRNAFANIQSVESEAKYANASDLLADFEDKLRTRLAVLDSVRVKSDDNNKKEVDDLSDDVESKIKASVKTRAALNAKVRVQPDVKMAVEGKLKAVENKLETTKKLLNNKKTTLNSQLQIEAEAQIEAAQSKIIEGQNKIEADAYGDAFDIFQDAQHEAQKAITIIQEGVKIEEDVDTRLESATEDEKKSSETETRVEVEARLETEVKTDVKIDLTPTEIKLDTTVPTINFGL